VKRPITSREAAVLAIVADAVLSGRERMDLPGNQARLEHDAKHYRRRVLTALRYHGQQRKRDSDPSESERVGE